MQLNKLILKNFFSHKKTTIDFTNMSDVMLIMGRKDGNTSESNGTGKTTILEAIRFAIFEKTRLTENKNATLDDMVRWNSDGVLEVEFYFTIGKDCYRIIRTRNKNTQKGSISFDIKVKEKWKSLCEGKKTATNKEIINKIGLDYKTFCSSICFQQKEVDEFVSSTESQRKAIIEDILQLKKYKEYSASAKAKAQVHQTEIKTIESHIEKLNINSLDLETKQTNLDKVENQIKIFLEEKKAITSQLEQLRKKQILFNEKASKKQRLEEQIEKATKSIAMLVDRNKLAIEKQEDYKAALESKTNDYRQANKKLENIKNKFTITKAEIQKQGKAVDKKVKQSEAEVEQLSSTYHKLVGEIENISQAITDTKDLQDARCKTCYSEITATSKKSALDYLKSHKELLKTKADSAELKLKKAKDLLETNKKQLEELKENLQDFVRWMKEKLHLQDNLKLYKQNLEEAKIIIKDQDDIVKENSSLIDSYKKDLEKNKQELETISVDTTEFKQLNNKIKQKDDLLADNLKLLSDAQIEKGQLQNQLSEFKKSIEAIKQYKKQREHLIKEKFYYEHLSKMFGKEIPTLIIENACYELGLEANKILSGISQDSIEFVTQRKNKDGSLKEVFEIEISRPGVDTPVLIDSLSNGQKFRVVFAIRVALSRLLARRRSSTNIDFLFYDECFASLDEKGIDDIIDVFKYLKQEFKHQIIITHRSDLKDRFGNNVLMVNQDDQGISTIEK